MYCEDPPTGVSYEKLLRVLNSRRNPRDPYADSDYAAQLTNDLIILDNEIKTQNEKHEGGRPYSNGD
jgi:hypothetical protein